MALPRALCGGFPRAQYRALELHDSKVLSVTPSATEVLIRLEAMVHMSTGVPAQDLGTIWVQELELRVLRGVVELSPPSGVLWITDGMIEVGALAFEEFPFELENLEPTRIDVVGGEGKLIVTGAGLKMSARGEPRFLERFDPRHPSPDNTR